MLSIPPLGGKISFAGKAREKNTATHRLFSKLFAMPRSKSSVSLKKKATRRKGVGITGELSSLNEDAQRFAAEAQYKEQRKQKTAQKVEEGKAGREGETRTTVCLL